MGAREAACETYAARCGGRRVTGAVWQFLHIKRADLLIAGTVLGGVLLTWW